MRKLLMASVLLIGLIIGQIPFSSPHHSSPIYAQTSAPPIIFLLNGDIYSYDVLTDETTQLTTWGYNEAPILSPDGTRFVYNSWASQAVEGILAGTLDLFSALPSNIWMWEIESGDAVRIAEQPANMIPPSNTDAGNGIIRSTPVWSPDGAQIAWTEVQLPDYGYRLVTYNFATETSRVLVDRLSLGFQDASLILQVPTWGRGGIAITRWDAGPDGFQQTLTVYHPFNGSIIFEDVVSTDDNSVLAHVWLDDAEDTLALASRGNWQLLNVVTGEYTDITAIGPYSRLAPSNTTFPVTTIYSASPLLVQIPAGSGLYESGNIGQLNLDVAISPDGNSIAYIDDALYVKLTNQVTVRVNGTTLDTSAGFGLNHGVVWGPIGWRRILSGTASPIVNNCTPSPRLSIGGQAQVLAGQGGGNVLRSLPQTGEFSEELTIIPVNETMKVISGPACHDGFYWWMVDFNGIRGWTPEGDGGTYWLEPIS